LKDQLYWASPKIRWTNSISSSPFERKSSSYQNTHNYHYLRV